MIHKLSFGNCIVLVFTFIFLAFDMKAVLAKMGPYDFTELIYQWPKSYCISDKVAGKGHRCKPPIFKNFTIRAFRLIYFPDEAVKPYNQTGCTETVPKPESSISYDLFALRPNPILEEMKKRWPNVVSRLKHHNEYFWKAEWKSNGMCYDQPDNPRHYFKTALDLSKKFNFLDILEQGGIRPDDDQKYYLELIRTAIHAKVKKRVTIFCSKTSDGSMLLGGFTVCFDKNGEQMSCTKPFVGCKDDNTNESKIMFPAAAAAA